MHKIRFSPFCISDLFDGSQNIYHSAVQLLSVGHDVPQRVEVSGVLDGDVNQRQQPVDGVHIGAQIHLGVSLCHQQPVGATAAHSHRGEQLLVLHITMSLFKTCRKV